MTPRRTWPAWPGADEMDPVTREVYDRVATGWLAPDAVGLRQVPATVSILVALVIVESNVPRADPRLLVAAALLVGAVQVAGLLLPWRHYPPYARAALPLLQLGAVALLDLGAGLPRAELDILLLLPMGMLALRPERWGPGLALAGAGVVLLAPAVVDTDRTQPLLHAVVTFLVLTPAVVGAHQIVQASRAQARELQRARDALDVRARQLQASRDTMSSIIEAATEQAVLAIDEQGTVLRTNSGAARILGRADLVGRAVTDLLVAEDDRAAVDVAELVGDAARGGAHTEEWRTVLPDGTTRHVEFVVTPRPALEGTVPEVPEGYLLVGTDVTPRREEERRQDEFVGLVSHELRTPLSSILGYVELLRSAGHPLDDEQRRYLDVVERNANRLRSLVDELLASAQVVVGAPAVVQELDVGDVVRGAVTAQEPVSRAAGVRVDVDTVEPVPLRSDPQRLAQVVDNLVSNAVKHSLAGQRVVVVVRPGTAEAGTREAVVQVVDEGAGIAPDELSRLTERFYRTRETRRRRLRGVGLGLSLVQAIVAEHGGTLSIRSELGAGTEVEVVLPDLPAAETED